MWKIYLAWTLTIDLKMKMENFMRKNIIFAFVFFSIWCGSASAQTGRVMDPIADWSAITSILKDDSISPDWRDAQGYSAAYYQLLYGSERHAATIISRSKKRGEWREGTNGSLLELAIYQHSALVVEALIKHENHGIRHESTFAKSLQLSSMRYSRHSG